MNDEMLHEDEFEEQAKEMILSLAEQVRAGLSPTCVNAQKQLHAIQDLIKKAWEDLMND